MRTLSHRSIFACLVLSFALSAQEAFEECTVGVASGRATPDGRALLWKTRDTSSRNNEVVRFTDGKYAYLALVSAGQTRSAWAGSNEKGFCIMNSVSPDFRYLKGKKKRKGHGNGGFMKLALQSCATVDEFEQLLKKTDKTGRRTRANFGVIDATGAAAIFETGVASFTRFDCADEKVAPHGFIVRSNFAMTAKDNARTKARSIERYKRGNAICLPVAKKQELTPKHLLRQFCRDLADKDGKSIQLPTTKPLDNDKCIARPSTRSAVVFHGVKGDEDPELTTFWAILGEPLFSVAVPCWVKSGGVAAPLDGEKTSPLCDAAIAMRKLHYVTRKTKTRSKSMLKTEHLARVWERTYPAEDAILEATKERLAAWRAKAPSREEVAKFHAEMAQRALLALIVSDGEEK